MRRAIAILALALSAAMAGQAGAAKNMNVWLLICARGDQCDLSNAEKWYQLDLPPGHIAKLIEFPRGRSMGTDSHIFFPCEEGELAPDADQYMRDMASRGSCLR